MRTAWKWVIGIVVVVVVLVALAGGAWLMRSRFAMMTRNVQTLPSQQLPQTTPAPNGQVPPYQYGQRGGPYMMPYRGGGRGFPMMGRRGGFGMMMPFAGLFGGLLFLGFIILVVLGIIWIVRSQSRRAAMTTAAPMMATPAAVTTHACANCGQPVQNGMVYCPNCGTKQ